MLIAIINTPNGCTYHRQLVPNALIAERGIDVIQTNLLRVIDEKSKWDKWKVIQFHDNDYRKQAPVARAKGLKVWVDMDDIWYLESQHPMFKDWQADNRVKVTEKFLRDADVITCANERLADMAARFNPHTYHIPNCISPLEPQFQMKHHEYSGGPVVFGWIGAKHHVQDIRLVASSLDKLYCDRKMSNRYRIVYGGYIINPMTGKADPISERIADYLRGNNSKYSTFHFGLMNATDHTRYAIMYQNIDVALAPLEATNYNQYKSELKLIEAGHFGIPVIASDVYPYNTVIKNGENGFLVKKDKDWLKAIKYFIEKPEEIKRMGDNLKEYINRRFNPKDITDKRIKIFETL